MQRRSPTPTQSFRLILYLEWILLGIMLLAQIRPTRFEIAPATFGFSLLAVIGFGLMGLKSPTGRRNKLLYTALEFSLLMATFLLDRRTGFFPLMGLVIVIRSCLRFQQAGRLAVTGLVFSVSLLMLFFGAPAPGPSRRLPTTELFTSTIWTLKLNTAVSFGLTLLFILLLVNALVAERQSREKLLLANTQLQQYALRIEDQATLQERNRIAREIHDSLGHALTAQSIQLENALLFLPAGAEKTETILQTAKQLGARALQEVRRSIATLRSDPLQGQSLEAVITKAVMEFRTMTEIVPDLVIQLTRPVPTEINTALYRIVQESLTNICKHSAATAVSIYLQTTGEMIQLKVDDNGRGFDPAQNTTGFGLQGIRERTVALGGQLTLVSSPGQGCHTTVSLPLPKLVV